MCSPDPTSIFLSVKHEIPCPGQVSAGKACGQRRERKLYTWVLCPLGIQILVWLLKEQGFILHKLWSLCWFISFPCTNLWKSSIFYILGEELSQYCRGKTHQNFKWWTLNQEDMPRNLRQSVWNWFFITVSGFLGNCNFQWTVSGTGTEFSDRSSASADVNGKMILEILLP